MEPFSVNVFEIVTDLGANPHAHLREEDVVGPAIRWAYSGGVDVLGPMLNLVNPLSTADGVWKYIKNAQSLDELKRIKHFIPIAVITAQTTLEEVIECIKAGIFDFKLYPRYRTTQSETGIIRYLPIIQLIKEADKASVGSTGRHIRVHVHPEHPSKVFINRDAEFVFAVVVQMLLEETQAFIIWEHGSDSRCIPHWKKWAEEGRFFVTLTAHHLATDEDKAFGDVRSVCKPPIKTAYDTEAFLDLVAENHLWVMAGADDAPHDVAKKHVHEDQCACGAYTAPFLMPLYAHTLDRLLQIPGGIEVFRNFTSHNCRELYDLPPASGSITLVRKPYRIPSTYSVGPMTVEPFWAGKTINWSFTT